MWSLPCRNRWCPNVQPCPQHPVMAFATGTPLPHDWPQIRANVLRAQPVCFHCGQPATEVDHIIERADGGDDSYFNLRGVCRTFHQSKTGRMAGAS